MEKLIRQPMLKRVIQDQVKQFITDRALGPGDLLPPEGQLADGLGVSRGSVREAIKSLESLGIVEVRHGDGVRVREFNFDSILDFLSYGLLFQPAKAAEILQIREWLEAAAVAEAAKSITDDELDQIEALLVVWEAKAAAREPTSQEDRSFHRLLYASLGNASLLSLIDIFWVVYNALPAQTVGQDPDPLATVKAHRELLAALRRRDPALAQRRMGEHFRNIEVRFDRVVELSRARKPARKRAKPGA
jgi:DNA-binding FadR family transcriptional regulator